MPFMSFTSFVWRALRLHALVLVLVLVLAPTAAPAAAHAEVLRLDTALAIDDAGTGVPPAAAPGRPVALPDDWTHSAPAGRVRWYRAAFELPPAFDRQQLLALSLARACTNFEVWLNGSLVHRDGRMSAPLTRQCGRPQLVTLPPSALRPGANRLELRVAGHGLAAVGWRQRAGALSALRIGPRDALHAAYAWQQVLFVAVPQALSMALVLLGGFAFMRGFAQRHQSPLAHFGALCAAAAIFLGQDWVPTLPFDDAVAEFLLSSLAAFLTLAAVQFLLRHADTRHAGADRWLALQCALVPSTLVLAGPERLYPVAAAWYAVLAVQVAAAGALHWRRHRPPAGAAVWPVRLLLGAAALTAVAQAVVQATGTQASAAAALHALLGAMLVVFGLWLLQQHGQVPQEALAGKALIDQRVREATAELERKFRHLAELRVEQVTERERKRIAADLHDDVGAKLLTIVHTSESDRISTLAREALDEMRLSVRGLTGKPVRLADALGDWRAEVVSRLAQAGIHAGWQAPDDLPQLLSARAFVQITRILREATSNAIKHSGASHCDVECVIADGDLRIVIRDDGEGIPMEMDGRLDRGHGLASMKQRARQLQGQCLVESRPGHGTVIRLTIPLDHATEPQ
jgi:signal transduction histidine kinase